MPGGPLEVGYGVSYLSIAIPVRGRAAIRAAPPCCPCLVPCAFAPITTTQRQSLEKLGIGGQAQCPLLTSRARAAQIALRA